MVPPCATDNSGSRGSRLRLQLARSPVFCQARHPRAYLRCHADAAQAWSTIERYRLQTLTYCAADDLRIGGPVLPRASSAPARPFASGTIHKRRRSREPPTLCQMNTFHPRMSRLGAQRSGWKNSQAPGLTRAMSLLTRTTPRPCAAECMACTAGSHALVCLGLCGPTGRACRRAASRPGLGEGQTGCASVWRPVMQHRKPADDRAHARPPLLRLGYGTISHS